MSTEDRVERLENQVDKLKERVSSLEESRNVWLWQGAMKSLEETQSGN